MSPDEFIALVHDELGLPITAEDMDRKFHDLAGWDSVYLLWLIVLIEQRTGRSINVIDVLEAPDLRHVYARATAG